MKKQILAIALALCLLISILSGCGKKGASSNPTDSNTASQDSSENSDNTVSSGNTSSENGETNSSSEASGNQNGNEEQGGNNQTPDPNEPDEPTVPDNSPTIYLEAENKEDKVILKVCAKNNPGVASFSFRVNYDKASVEPEKIEKGLINVTSNLQQTTKLAGYITAVYVDINGINKDGTLFTITFKPKAGAKKAAFSITADDDAFVNADIKPVKFKVKGTEIKF